MDDFTKRYIKARKLAKHTDEQIKARAVAKLEVTKLQLDRVRAGSSPNRETAVAEYETGVQRLEKVIAAL